MINRLFFPALDGRLPAWVQPQWFGTQEELSRLAPQAEIGWFDSHDLESVQDPVERATGLKWLNTLAAGVDVFPLALLRQRGVVLTNGAGINAGAIAEYAVMGMLAMAKGFREVLCANDRHEWLDKPPGAGELGDGTALVLGAGAIGGAIADRLAAFGMAVSKVRRRPGNGDLGIDDWRARLGEFDWVIVAAPSTPDTERMLGRAEFAAMKRGVGLVNVARGAVVDQPALVDALRAGHIGHAFLDVTDPEPLPPDHPLWSMPNVIITMHLSGRSQTRMVQRSADRFLANLGRYRRGEPLGHMVDLALGY